MIKYDRFWVTMKERGITQYDLYEHYEITRSLLDRLRKNKNIEIFTIDRLCSILHCDIEDIVEHIHKKKGPKPLSLFILICSLRSFRNLVSGKRHLQDRRRCQPEQISQELLQRLQIRRTGYESLLL